MECYKLFSLLLDYPTEQLWLAQDELIEYVDTLDDELTATQKTAILQFMQAYFSLSLLDAQEEYYQTFEIGNMTSLLLFEHVHGDSRDRGQAMVDLIEQYREQGLVLTNNQLPDYLPLFLEYLSLLPEQESEKWLNNILLVLRLIALRLEKRDSQFSPLFNLLCELSSNKVNDNELQHKVAHELPDNTKEALDKVWQETQVLFQGNAAAMNNSTNTKNNHINSTYYVNVGSDKRSQI